MSKLYDVDAEKARLAKRKETITRMRREGMSFKEMAVELDIAVPTIKRFCVKHRIGKGGIALPNKEDKE